jgi:hypothetical protein
MRFDRCSANLKSKDRVMRRAFWTGVILPLIRIAKTFPFTATIIPV